MLNPTNQTPSNTTTQAFNHLQSRGSYLNEQHKRQLYLAINDGENNLAKLNSLSDTLDLVLSNILGDEHACHHLAKEISALHLISDMLEVLLDGIQETQDFTQGIYHDILGVDV